MKLIIAALLIPFAAWGQPQTLITKVPVSQWGHMANALITTPKEYLDSPNKRYPLIIFHSGRAEQGTDITKLYTWGIPKRVKAGWEPQAVDPNTGLLTKFIVITPQAQYFGVSAAEMIYAYRWLKDKYRIDTNRVYTTGLSAGGWAAFQFANWDSAYAKIVAATAVCSPSSLPDQSVKNIYLFGKYNIPIWYRVGTNDYTGPFYEDALSYQKKIKETGGSIFLQTHTQGHGGWEEMYNESAKIPWNGKQLNVYEWFLTSSKVLVQPPIIDQQICIGMASQIKEIIVFMKDGTYRRFDSTAASITNIQITGK